MDLHVAAECHSLPETCEPGKAIAELGLEKVAVTSALPGTAKRAWTLTVNAINDCTLMSGSLPGPGLGQWRHLFTGSLLSQCLIRILRAI